MSGWNAINSQNNNNNNSPRPPGDNDFATTLLRNMSGTPRTPGSGGGGNGSRGDMGMASPLDQFSDMPVPSADMEIPLWAYGPHEAGVSQSEIRHAHKYPPPLEGVPKVRRGAVCRECIRRWQPVPAIQQQTQLPVSEKCSAGDGTPCTGCKSSSGKPSCTTIPSELSRCANILEYLRMLAVHPSVQNDAERVQRRVSAFRDYASKVFAAIVQFEKDVLAELEVKKIDKAAQLKWIQARRKSREANEKAFKDGRGELPGSHPANIVADPVRERQVLQTLNNGEKRLVYYGQHAR